MVITPSASNAASVDPSSDTSRSVNSIPHPHIRSDGRTSLTGGGEVDLLAVGGEPAPSPEPRQSHAGYQCQAYQHADDVTTHRVVMHGARASGI